jgi:Domain of unknown function (DUF4177)
MTSTETAPPQAADHASNGDVDGLVAALLPSRAPREQASASEPVVWEYRTELIERGFMGFGNEQVDLETLQALLDGLGAEGWELVQATWNHRVRRRRGGHVLLFKRPRPAVAARA